ncbi:hypothetical protein V6N12_024430 [Hibiscus sabdariffa]|uniref:Defensin-like domain-containing protein n=1 Tax=Hibiscus sabdariffa TaxID=183260 RepID=A0ABR2G0J7_9ROSI
MAVVVEKYILALVFAFVFILSSVRSDVEVNGVGVDVGPMCFKTCSASYGDSECNIDCVANRYAGGSCVGPERRCCCRVSLV